MSDAPTPVPVPQPPAETGPPPTRPIVPATNPHVEVDADAEAHSTWVPDGWVEGEQLPGPIPEDNEGDDAGVDEHGNEPGFEAPADL